MANYQVRAVIPLRSGLPQDVSVNTWSIVGPDTEGGRDAIMTALNRFYTETGDTPTTAAVGTYLGPQVRRSPGLSRFEMYVVDLASGETGSPIRIDNWVVPVGPLSADLCLPNEVAVCTSFASGAPAGVNAARRKGRVYIGPLTKTVVTNDPITFQPRLTDAFVASLVNSTERLHEELIAAGAQLCVWSRADAAMYPVVRGWVDLEFDTQRRRGEVATARVNWP